ncbi:MAG: hypothetical protein JO125_05795 [Chloroflexi bacterium]|nr:hypothetical protein [Chloroflexota bacterium]
MAEPQPYDRALKALMDDHAAEVVPQLLPGSQVVQELNTEITRTNLRADLLYLIVYKGTDHILHLELQTNLDTDMNYRMLDYHVDVYGKYRLPVISMVLYPFETTIPEPLFHEQSADETLLAFPYRVVRLWKLEAEQFVSQGLVSMYTLLPAMQGVTAPMLLHALEAMESRYQRGPTLTRHLWRFQIILRRSKTLTEQEKHIVEDSMDYYDSLLDSDPEIQAREAKAAAQATAQAAAQTAQAVAQATVQAKQETMLLIVKTRFPDLVELAKQQAVHLTPDQLDLITQQIVLAPNQDMARFALGDVAA